MDPDEAKILPIVKLLAVPAAVLKRRAFRISILAVPALIELKAPAAVKTEPIEALLIVPANKVPTVKVLTVPEAVLKIRVFRISVFIVLVDTDSATTVTVLNEAAITSPMLINPLSLPIVRLSTVSDDTYTCETLNELNEPSKAETVLVVRRFMKKLLANPSFVEILRAVKTPVLSKVVLKTGGTNDIPPPLTIPVNNDPSPTKRPNIVPAEIVEKNP
jgi:hypothetical protein